MSQLLLTNVINISVSAAPAGVGTYNTSNVALFTTDTPGGGFGSLGYKIYLDPTEVTTDFGTGTVTADMANAVFSQQPNILAGGGYLVVIPFTSGELLSAAITRTVGLVQYFGVMSTQIETQAHILAAAAVVQPLNKILFVVKKTAADVVSGGALDLITTGGFHNTRGLLYIGAGVDNDSLVMMASYVGRALSVNFEGSNTTSTMHLKDFLGVQPDSGITQSILNDAQLAGADCYPSLQGVPKVFTSGANQFFDQVYNLQWFIGALQVAGFNYLATSSTKVPQTENGMDGLKGAYASVCLQGVSNQYLAPGTWNSPNTFGNQADLLANIQQAGFYIYSQPIALQSQVSRAARTAPLCQIAAKEAGAIQKSNVIVYVNP